MVGGIVVHVCGSAHNLHSGGVKVDNEEAVGARVLSRFCLFLTSGGMAPPFISASTS
ncbi:hypothetical protein BH20ACT22_BH20ACT22_16090 [soil metagenome]